LKSTIASISSIIITLLLVNTTVVSGQVKRNSFTSLYGGYSYWHDTYEGEDVDDSYHGFRISLELKWNAGSPIGFIIDFGNYKEDRALGQDRRLSTYMAGIRYSFKREKIIEPFLQPLFGIAYIGRFGFDLGGGIDFNLAQFLALRIMANAILQNTTSGDWWVSPGFQAGLVVRIRGL
jgi:hypothetical protein